MGEIFIKQDKYLDFYRIFASNKKISYMKYRIKELCKEKDITLEELAKAINTSQSSISRIITGNGNPTMETLKKIADALKVKLSDLFEKKESDIIGFLRVHGYLKQVSSLEDLEQLVDDIKTGKI
ncbi:helix-turn-helix transcriptional regulator [Butyricimonas sp.]|uniref:helix-turn-helix domain-containing protein n=1 Tax=Butyricimonas sp. TaxID=1969738 RepID=UPI00257BDC59|nr:helix-turn-helix transcriptional regulator [Butyricimonas sp.]